MVDDAAAGSLWTLDSPYPPRGGARRELDLERQYYCSLWNPAWAQKHNWQIQIALTGFYTGWCRYCLNVVCGLNGITGIFFGRAHLNRITARARRHLKPSKQSERPLRARAAELDGEVGDVPPHGCHPSAQDGLESSVVVIVRLRSKVFNKPGRVESKVKVLLTHTYLHILKLCCMFGGC